MKRFKQFVDEGIATTVAALVATGVTLGVATEIVKQRAAKKKKEADANRQQNADREAAGSFADPKMKTRRAGKDTPKTRPTTNKPVHVWIGDEKDHPERKKKLNEGLFDFFKKKKFEDPHANIKAIHAQSGAALKKYTNSKSRNFARDRRWSNHHGDDLNSDEKSSVNNYTGSGYQHINERLWHAHKRTEKQGRTEHTDGHIKTLHSMLNRSTAPESTILTRGTRHLPDHVKSGDIIHSPAFSSASRDAKVAKEFSNTDAHDGSNNHQHHYWQASHHDSDGKPKEGTSANGTKVKHGDKYDPKKHGEKPEKIKYQTHSDYQEKQDARIDQEKGAGGSFEPASHIMKIRVKKGQTGVRSMRKRFEHETLINAGANYKVHRQTHHADTNTVTTHVSLEGHSPLHKDIK